MKGFVDLQFNGWMGLNFTSADLTLEQLRRVTGDLVARGTVAYCPTVITGPMEVYRAVLPLLARAMEEPDLKGRLLGIHLEGPYISPEPGARGAHPPECVRAPDVAEFDQLLEWAGGKVAMLTVAPERPGATELIRHAVRRGVVVSLGHHLADDAVIEAAVKAGATVCTHVGNGIPNQMARHPNAIWSQLAHDELWGMFITDGQHLPASVVKVALRAKTVKRFVVTSDASPLAGLPPGRYEALGLAVVINEQGRIFSEKTQGLVGSHSTLLECMNFLAGLGLLTEEELWQVGCLNPLQVLGRSPQCLVGLKGPEPRFRNGRFEMAQA